MKTKKLILNLFATAVVVGAITGCASRGYDKASDTASTLNESSDLITKSSRLIDESLANLDDLVTNPQPDLHLQFKAFESSVNDLHATEKDLATKDEELKSQGADYFAHWDREAAAMQNEDIRDRSEARKNEVSAHFARVSQQYDETKSAFQKFMSDLRDVQKFLSTDLTGGGLAAVKDVSVKANEDAVPLKTSLASLSEEFKELGVALSPQTPAQ